MTTRKFYKKTIVIEVLSEDTPFDFTNMESLGWALTSVDLSGSVVKEEVQELSGEQAATALLEQGSDPEFFNIDKDGNDLN